MVIISSVLKFLLITSFTEPTDRVVRQRNQLENSLVDAATATRNASNIDKANAQLLVTNLSTFPTTRCLPCWVVRGVNFTKGHTGRDCVAHQVCISCYQTDHKSKDCKLNRIIHEVCYACLIPKEHHDSATYNQKGKCPHEFFRIMLLLAYRFKRDEITALRRFPNVQEFFNYISQPKNSIPLYLSFFTSI